MLQHRHEQLWPIWRIAGYNFYWKYSLQIFGMYFSIYLYNTTPLINFTPPPCITHHLCKTNESNAQIYAVRNAEILTCHEAPITAISHRAGWIEFDPVEIWKCVVECIKVGTRNLIILDINPADIIGLGITNQRETTVLWHRTNGTPVYNAIG